MRAMGEQASVPEWKVQTPVQGHWAVCLGQKCIQLEDAFILFTLQFCFYLIEVFAQAKTIK